MAETNLAHLHRAKGFALATLALLACTGYVGDAGPDRGAGLNAPATGSNSPATGTSAAGGTTAAPPTNPVSVTVGPGRLRRLTRAQLENSVHDLLGAVPLAPTEPDSSKDGFVSVGATYVVTSDTGVEQYHTALKGAVQAAFANASLRGVVAPCVPATITDNACMQTFVQRFGQRAWRRPVTPAETDRYVQMGLYAAKTLNDANSGLEYIALGMLDSPYFLYRAEIGEPDPSAGGRYRYTAYETASRLSYLLWNTTPDDALLAAAASGALDNPQGVHDQVTRLLGQQDRARAGLANYARELLELDAFLAKTGADPRYTPTLRAAMADEVIHLFADRLDPASDALDILNTTSSFVTPELATLYGIQGVSGATGAPALLPASVPRAGLLGTGLFLAKTSKIDAHETSLTARGVFITEQILCQPVPPPPDNVDTTLHPIANMPQTKRQMMEEHRKNPACAGCHGTFDPIGAAFEEFDWIGAYRTAETTGLPVDTTGSYQGATFANAKDLVGLLRKATEVQSCFLKHVFRYSMGHKETTGDQTLLDDWNSRFANASHNLPRFFTDVASSDTFRYVSVAPAP
jgi:hypothetical protein